MTRFPPERGGLGRETDGWPGPKEARRTDGPGRKTRAIGHQARARFSASSRMAQIRWDNAASAANVSAA